MGVGAGSARAGPESSNFVDSSAPAGARRARVMIVNARVTAGEAERETPPAGPRVVRVASVFCWRSSSGFSPRGLK